jgi:hypothetical protein
MKTKELKLSNQKVKKFYASLLIHMRKQYKDVQSITEAHINEKGKVFSAQWIDSKGVINFCGGWAIDCVKVVKFS